MRLFDPALLEQMLDQGYVNVRYHPDDNDYRIYNYSDKAAYERVWNPVTKQCRGLIMRGDEVLARPFPKFFNYGEPGADLIQLDEYVNVVDKADGSLGIIYAAPDGKPAIATRGSFTSEQAIWATNFLRANNDYWQPMAGVTYLCEIIYPANRIVLDYSGLEDLILLGVLDTEDHYPILDDTWPFSRVPIYGYEPLQDALARPPRPNAEGYVLTAAGGRRLKVKQADYLELHRVVTNLTEKRVWEHLRDNDYQYADLAASVPDEFAAQVKKWGDALLTKAEYLADAARSEFAKIATFLQDEQDRKIWADHIKMMAHPKLGFLLLDGRDIMGVVWRMTEPKGE